MWYLLMITTPSKAHTIAIASGICYSTLAPAAADYRRSQLGDNKVRPNPAKYQLQQTRFHLETNQISQSIPLRYAHEGNWSVLTYKQAVAQKGNWPVLIYTANTCTQRQLASFNVQTSN
jgi:hypothetical protein